MNSLLLRPVALGCVIGGGPCVVVKLARCINGSDDGWLCPAVSGRISADGLDWVEDCCASVLVLSNGARSNVYDPVGAELCITTRGTGGGAPS